MIEEQRGRERVYGVEKKERERERERGREQVSGEEDAASKGSFSF